jgi:hypothetical protein
MATQYRLNVVELDDLEQNVFDPGLALDDLDDYTEVEFDLELEAYIDEVIREGGILID